MDQASKAVKQAVVQGRKQVSEERRRKVRERAAARQASRSVRTFASGGGGRAQKYSRAGGGQKFYASIKGMKIKTQSALQAIDEHNSRSDHITINVNRDRTRLNRVIIGDSAITVQDAVMSFITRSGQKVRKNSVLAHEFVIWASPGYFTQGSAEEQAARLDDWLQANKEYLKDQFGDAVVRLDLHMDETSPHLHCVLAHTPTGPQSSSAIFGGERDSLRQLQTGYSSFMSFLGLERGEPKNEKAPASTLAEFYSKMNEPLPSLPAVTPPPAGPRPQVSRLQSLGLASDSAEQIRAQEKWDRQMKAHRDSKVAREKWMVTHLDQYHKRAQVAELAKLQASRAIESYRQKESEFDRIKRIADQVKDIDLVDVLKKLGATESASSKEGHKSREFVLDGQKIAITNNLFVIQGSREGGRGAINLMMKLDNSSFKDSVQSLSEMFGEDAATTALAAHRVDAAKTDLQAILQEPPTLPARDESKTAQVRSYLTERGIPEYWADHFLSKGVVYADQRGNAVIPRANGGAFIRGTVGGRNNKFKRTLGAGALGGFHLPGNDGTLILCEGPLDALALRTMHPESQIICTGGNLIDLKSQEIATAVAAATEVKAAFDNDQQGRQFAANLKKIYGEKVSAMLPPDEGMDWSEKLRLNPQFAKAAPGQPEYQEASRNEEKEGMTL